MGIALKNTHTAEFLSNEEQLKKFNECVSKHLHDLIPELMNEIAVNISKCFTKVSKNNLLANAISLYPSLMGSYLYKPSIKQVLTPTVRTLHHLEQQMLDNYSEARGTENSLWVIMYLISAMFVHLFGKYITPYEKMAVG